MFYDHAIIVDDEAASREESLKILPEDFCSNVLVSALCRNVAGKDGAIHAPANPDVVFSTFRCSAKRF